LGEIAKSPNVVRLPPFLNDPFSLTGVPPVIGTLYSSMTPSSSWSAL
jgi:hypothetical protein